MRKLVQLTIILVTLLGCIGCDQATKTVAKAYLPHNEVMSFAGDTFRLQYAENKGAFLSLGASFSDETRKIIFTVGNSLLLFGVLAFLIFARALPRLTTVALSLIVGGGFSNIVDRVIHDGYVIDFLNIGIGNLRTGIFNIADVAIMLGSLLFIIKGFHFEKPRESF